MNTTKLGKKQSTYKAPGHVRKHYRAQGFLQTGAEFTEYGSNDAPDYLRMYRYTFKHENRNETKTCTAFEACGFELQYVDTGYLGYVK